MGSPPMRELQGVAGRGEPAVRAGALRVSGEVWSRPHVCSLHLGAQQGCNLGASGPYRAALT